MDRLTGRIRLRIGWFGRLVLQVEYKTLQPYPGTDGRSTDWLWTGADWRDAKVQDVTGEHAEDIRNGMKLIRPAPSMKP